MRKLSLQETINNINIEQFGYVLKRDIVLEHPEKVVLDALTRVIDVHIHATIDNTFSTSTSLFAEQAMQLIAERHEQMLTESNVVEAMETYSSHLAGMRELTKYHSLHTERLLNSLHFTLNTFKQVSYNSMTGWDGTFFTMALSMSSTQLKHIKRMLESGADLQVKTNRHGKALHFFEYSMSSHAESVLDLLLEHGANPTEPIEFIPFFHRLENKTSYSSYVDRAMKFEKKLYDSMEKPFQASDQLQKLMQYGNNMEALSSAKNMLQQGRVSRPML